MKRQRDRKMAKKNISGGGRSARRPAPSAGAKAVRLSPGKRPLRLGETRGRTAAWVVDLGEEHGTPPRRRWAYPPHDGKRHRPGEQLNDIPLDSRTYGEWTRQMERHHRLQGRRSSALSVRCRGDSGFARRVFEPARSDGDLFQWQRSQPTN